MAKSKSGVRWVPLIVILVPVLLIAWAINRSFGLILTLIVAVPLAIALLRTSGRNAKAAKWSREAVASFGATHQERLANIAQAFDDKDGTLTFGAAFQWSQTESYQQGYQVFGNQAVARNANVNQLYKADFTFSRPIATLSPRGAAYLRAALELSSLRDGRDVTLNDQCASLVYENGRGAVIEYSFKPSSADPGPAAAANAIFAGANLSVEAVQAQLDMFAHSAHASAEEADIADRLKVALAVAERQQVPVAYAAPAKSLGEQIAELQQLRDAGTLTEEQFEAAKAKLL